MRKEDAKSLVYELSGNEYSWVDFKKDYEIGGIGLKKAEFIKDISSLANTITDKDEHYLLIGVNDNGNITGITPGRDNYRGSGPRHIFSYDESDIQQIVDSNLEPAPKLAWFTFEEDGDDFGILVVKPLSTPPTITTQHINDDSGNRMLHKGLIFVRKGSSKKIADREELERIIKYRIEKQRDQILDGIHKAIDLGPEWIDRIGQALPEEPGVPLATTDNPGDADVEITQRITRDPASTLDEQLNGDISQWNGRGDDYTEPRPLYEYYANPGELRLDDIALKFLTQCAIKNNLLGTFWLDRIDEESYPEILLSTPDNHHRIIRAGKVLLLIGNREIFDALVENSSSSADRGKLRDCKQKMRNNIGNRANYLLVNNGSYILKNNEWKEEFNPKQLKINEIRSLISQVANQLMDLQELFEERKAWDKTYKFRDALWDLEVVLGQKSFSTQPSDSG